MASVPLTVNITAEKIRAAGGERVTLICFEHDHRRDAIMCNVPFLNFQGN